MTAMVIPRVDSQLLRRGSAQDPSSLPIFPGTLIIFGWNAERIKVSSNGVCF
jgi:hypothetical protein